jgi:hypothetical protein
MCNVLVYVWRGDFHVAVLSVTNAKFLADLKAWIKEQDEYRLTIREMKLGPEHD